SRRNWGFRYTAREDYCGTHGISLPFEQSDGTSYVGEMLQFIAPNCLHGSRPGPVAVGDVRPSLAAALVLFQPLVARRVRKTAAPDLVPTVTVRMMNGAFQIRWLCRCCPCCQEQHSDTGYEDSHFGSGLS